MSLSKARLGRMHDVMAGYVDGPLGDTVPANRSITVRDLLTFRAGYGIVMAPPDTYPIQKAMSEHRLGQGPPKPQTPPAPDEWIRRLGTLPLMHQPGTDESGGPRHGPHVELGPARSTYR